MRTLFKGVILGAVAMLLLGVAAWLAVAYTGVYNVAASDWHADAVRWTLDTTMHRSVSVRADEIQLPERFSPDLVTEGAGHFAGNCVPCHGAPGVEPAGWSRGMRPEPPDLVEAAAEWSPDEIYWIAEHGIKMTGMPAFGGHHGPGELTAIAAFVAQLPGLTPEAYARMTQGEGAHGPENPRPE